MVDLLAGEETRYRELLALSADGPQTLGRLIDGLYDPSWRVRKAAAARLARSSRPAEVLPKLLSVLADRGQAGARNAAAEALAGLGDVAVPSLLILAGHLDADQRRCAVEILGQLGSAPVQQALVSALRDGDLNVRAAAAEALGRVGGEEAVRALEGLLEEAEPLLRLGGLEGLLALKRSPSLTSLLPLLEDPLLGASAHRLLGLSSAPQALQRLCRALADGRAPVRQAALAGLGTQAKGLRGDGRGELAREVRSVLKVGEGNLEFAKALTNADPEVRAGAMFVAAAMGEASWAPEVAEAAADGLLAEQAVLSLTSMGAGATRLLTERFSQLSTGARAVATAALEELSEAPPDSAPVGPRPTGRLSMSREEFGLLRSLVYEHSGILLRDEMKFMVERRLAPRVLALGLSDFAAYHRHLRFAGQGHGEVEQAIEALTTHETYFFREPLQLQAFHEELLPRLAESNASTRTLRLWSAGCSTGEEPYTLAMLVLESGRFTGWDVEVYGTDLSRQVLTAARRGDYGPSAMRSAPDGLSKRYLEQIASARWRVKPEVRALVRFGQHNLLDAQGGLALPRMDAVFCRNVMIYFDGAARRRALEVLHERLAEGGYLLLGHSESLLSASTDFEVVELGNDLVYRRPLAGKAATP